jgi:hypothetical protein
MTVNKGNAHTYNDHKTSYKISIQNDQQSVNITLISGK